MTYGVVDLFCGVGGLTCGLEAAGLNVIAGYDLDASCEYTYTHNNNAIFINRNIEFVTGQEIKKLLRGYDVKVLAGCAPCQPFSRHQKDKRNRKKHKDWKLLYQFGRLVQEVKPHIVSMENVPELENEQVFLDFVKILNDLKYKVTYKVVNAADYGVPQRRKRLLLLASRIKKIEFIEPTHKEVVTVREVIGIETRGYLNNHTERDTSKINITKEEARKNLNKNLEITSEGLAIIPTEWKTEILCYEYKGKIDDTDFLVYINAETGREENILVIIDTPNGILTQ